MAPPMNEHANEAIINVNCIEFGFIVGNDGWQPEVFFVGSFLQFFFEYEFGLWTTL